ncbi:TatD family hydrolase [Desulfovibrio litoralis]|uniref:TatD DNase family protein n=1 Tax=Desulfovibrio litoralis DSM 11393 TaxID=1121455 RepID=A0A1M7RXS7_9BACT|nr:TatD family hydrolase [Desulfovibrio litoralis]SHN51119.1 TatD DNase family protein [Desulfovibrio litoralis DSM 11393]
MNEQEKIYVGGFDSHAHLDMKEFDGEIIETVQRAKDVGIIGITNVFLSPKAYYAKHKLFENIPEVVFTLGIHPSDAHNINDDTLSEMKKIFLEEPRLKAVGEIGLDYYWKDCPQDIQHKVFKEQLLLAKELNKPVVIHSRDAFEDTVDILLDLGFSQYPLLWHCFGGNIAQAEKLLAQGWDISVPGVFTYPKNIELRETVKHIPLDRLHLESDCPFLAPQKYRGKRNEPAYCFQTAKMVAETLDIDLAELWKRTGKNSQRFFNV